MHKYDKKVNDMGWEVRKPMYRAQIYLSLCSHLLEATRKVPYKRQSQDVNSLVSTACNN